MGRVLQGKISIKVNSRWGKSLKYGLKDIINNILVLLLNQYNNWFRPQFPK